MLYAAALIAMQTAVLAPAAPFDVGERIEYGGKFGLIPVGSATLSVEAVEAMRGVPSWRFSLASEVAVLGYKQQSVLTSWTGRDDWISRQFRKAIAENGRDRHETFRIYPDSGFYRRNDNTETKATPTNPLDDIAFIYWVRTIPLTVGQTYRFNNYFRDEFNPVVVRVEKRATRELPDGRKVPALLLRPIVNEDGGMFHEKAKAKLWLTDDSRRIPLEIESTYFFGTVKLVIRAYTPPSPGE